MDATIMVLWSDWNQLEHFVQHTTKLLQPVIPLHTTTKHSNDIVASRWVLPMSVFVFWLDGAWCKCRVRRTYLRLLSLVSHYWHYICFMQLSLDIQIPNLLFVKSEPLSYSMSRLWWQFWCNLPWQHKITKENSLAFVWSDYFQYK